MMSEETAEEGRRARSAPLGAIGARRALDVSECVHNNAVATRARDPSIKRDYFRSMRAKCDTPG